MAAISERFGSGGANLAPGGASGTPSLAEALRDVADDLAALKPTPVVAGDASAAYGAAEQALLNELKTKVNALAAIVLKTTKAP
ncbi:MAG TPA: hypothetical protein VHC69_27800 [Polyangiaceae bacterium]|nr:hypothetical protein [Polyangiaceae bacterium]